MKVVYIGGRDIRTLGGIENYMYNLATQLVQLGHTPIVYCESDRNNTQTINGFEVRYVKGPKSNLLCKPWVSLKATLRTIFKDKDVDLIHYNAWPPSIWSWIPRMVGIPSLMEGHGLEWQRSKYSPKAQLILKMMERITAHTNKNLVMCSEEQSLYFRNTYGKESVCIPGGINLPSEESGTSSNILMKYGLVAGHYFLFMGRLVQDKNPDYLIKAFIQSNITGYKLVIAGDNEALPEYVQYLHKIGNCPDVVFTGAVYGEDKAALLRGAYAFCLPSTIEGLSIVLMEAMSYRLPIIASDIQANRELLDNNAIFVKPENEADLSNALKHSIGSTFWKEYTENNYSKISTAYTWPEIASRYIACIQKML